MLSTKHRVSGRFLRKFSVTSLGNINLNREMILSGYAVSYNNEFFFEEKYAKILNRGIWDSEFTIPKLWRKSQKNRKTNYYKNI